MLTILLATLKPGAQYQVTKSNAAPIESISNCFGWIAHTPEGEIIVRDARKPFVCASPKQLHRILTGRGLVEYSDSVDE